MVVTFSGKRIRPHTEPYGRGIFNTALHVFWYVRFPGAVAHKKISRKTNELSQVGNTGTLSALTPRRHNCLYAKRVTRV